jgi:hypothetical protein
MIVYYLTGDGPDEQIPGSSSPNKQREMKVQIPSLRKNDIIVIKETSNVPYLGENSSDRGENTNLLNGEQSQDNLLGDLMGWDTDSIHSIT